MENIEYAIQQLPELTNYGRGVESDLKAYLHNWERFPKKEIIKRENIRKAGKERKKEFEQEQKKLLDNKDAFEKTCEWLKQIKPIKTISRYYPIDCLTNMAKREIKDENVSPGVMIAAAICMGFTFATFSNRSPEAIYFNMSQLSIHRLLDKKGSGVFREARLKKLFKQGFRFTYGKGGTS